MASQRDPISSNDWLNCGPETHSTFACETLLVSANYAGNWLAGNKSRSS